MQGANTFPFALMVNKNNNNNNFKGKCGRR